MFVRNLFSLTALPAMGLCFWANPMEARPNVVLIMTDDQGYGDVGIHGHPYLKTPHMDWIALVAGKGIIQQKDHYQ